MLQFISINATLKNPKACKPEYTKKNVRRHWGKKNLVFKSEAARDRWEMRPE